MDVRFKMLTTADVVIRSACGSSKYLVLYLSDKVSIVQCFCLSWVLTIGR